MTENTKQNKLPSRRNLKRFHRKFVNADRNVSVLQQRIKKRKRKLSPMKSKKYSLRIILLRLL